MKRKDWELKSESSSHYIFKCPECDTSKVRPTLYLDKKSGKFHCFRCGYSGIESDFLFYNEYKVDKKENEVSKDEFFDTSLIKDMKKDSPQYSYLVSRGLTDEVITRYNFKVYDELFNSSAVFIHNGIVNNRTNFYQLRFINSKDKNFRYYNAKVSNKPIFGLQGIRGNNTLVICEGIFTSIGIQKINVDSICLLGKTISDFQKNQLDSIVKNNNYNEIVVGLDKDTNSETKRLSEYLMKSYDCKVSAIVLDTDRDYADQDKDEIEENYSKRIRITTSNLDMWDYLTCKN